MSHCFVIELLNTYNPERSEGSEILRRCTPQNDRMLKYIINHIEKQRNIMRIGFDARMINHSGIGIYIENLLNHMLPMDRGNQYVLFGPKNMLKQKIKGIHAKTLIVDCDHPIYSLKEQVVHPVFQYRVNLLHIPHYNVPIFFRGDMVTTIHDVNHLKHPEFLPNQLAYHYAKYLIKKACQKSKQWISVSQSTLDDVKSILNVDVVKGNVIHEALRGDFNLNGGMASQDYAKSKYSLPERFALFVGTMKPNKNILRMINCFSQVRSKTGRSMKLVLVGKTFSNHPEINQKIQEAVAEGWILHLDNVPHEDLKAIYELAECFLFLSLQEGFGLPLLEAFATDTAVIASNVSSLPEIAGSGALFVDPENEGDIKRKLLDLYNDEGLRKELVKRGKKELKRFSWDKTAKQTLEVYKKAVGNG